LRALHRARRSLLEQLGLEPSRELVELETAILTQDVVLDGPTHPVVTASCPYKGLATYSVDDRDTFFGRDGQIALCLDRLRTVSVLVVCGPSGSGKSSLVRAGLVPALQRPDRPVTVIVPGADPLTALAAATGSPCTLVVDQFEELFAAEVADEVVRQFCAAVAARADAHPPVVLTVRADHLTELAVDPALGQLVERGLHFVAPLTTEELRAAIEGPARQAGLRVEHGLVELVARDAEGEPGALPMLSHALAETWRRRDGSVLTVEGYLASGGIRGAVARSADQLYEALSAEQRPLLRSLMLRLVVPSPEGDPMCCRLPTSTLRGDERRQRVVAELVRARLLTTDEDTVELAHEALARAWPRLRSWLDDDAAGQRIVRHLATAADGWRSLGCPDSELYRGARLETALEHIASAQPDLTDTERSFVDASRALAESERLALEARVRRDARRNRLLRNSLVATAVLLVLALVAGTLAFRSGGEAREQRTVARLEALVNRSLALRATDRDVAALLAVEAERRWPGDARATAALMGTFTAADGFLGHRYIAGAERWLDGALVPGTTTAVVALDGDRLAVADMASGAIDDRLDDDEQPDGFGIALRVSGDGRFVVQLRGVESPGCNDEASLAETNGRGCATISVYDVASGVRTFGPVTPPFGPGDVAISGDGSRVAAVGGDNGDLAVYRTGDGVLVGTLANLPPPEGVILMPPGTPAAAVGFGPDGMLAVGSVAGPVRVVDPETLDVLRAIDAPPRASNRSVVVGTDGVVVASGDEAIVAGDTTSGRTDWVFELRGHDYQSCGYLAAGTDRIYCGDYSGVVEERDRATGQRTGRTFPLQHGPVGALSLSEDGDELVAFRGDLPAIARWRLDGSGLATRQIAAGYALLDGYDLVDDTDIVVARRDPGATIVEDFNDFALWDTTIDRMTDPLDFGQRVEGVVWMGPHSLTGFLPDELRIVWYATQSRSVVDGVEIPFSCQRQLPSRSGSVTYCLVDSGEVWTLDPATRRRVEPTYHVEGQPYWASETPDGSLVAITSTEGVTTVHDGRTGERVGGRLVGPWATVVGPNGVLIGATTGITLYDLDTLEPFASMPGAGGAISRLQLDDAGTTLLASASDGTVLVYDIATRTRLGDPIPHDAPALDAAFLRHDGLAVALTDQHGVAIWDLDRGHLSAAACQLAGRNLTPIEWESYLADLGPHRPTCPEFAR
jgi:WD40 repeat protein